MPGWAELGCTEYTKRMPRELGVEIISIKPDKRSSGRSAEQVQAAEASRILEAAGRDLLIVLDEHGAMIDTSALAVRLESWRADGRNVALVIGGADGLDQQLREKADWCWSLSRLTLPHAMVRVVLVEQLYRAWTLLSQHPYHRA